MYINPITDCSTVTIAWMKYKKASILDNCYERVTKLTKIVLFYLFIVSSLFISFSFPLSPIFSVQISVNASVNIKHPLCLLKWWWCYHIDNVFGLWLNLSSSCLSLAVVVNMLQPEGPWTAYNPVWTIRLHVSENSEKRNYIE